jgi:hypothetical protein
MVAGTEPVEGFVYGGEVYCADCGNGAPYDGKSDSPTHCGGCGVPIIHELTDEGIEYVRNTPGGCARELWPTVWGIISKIPVDSIVMPTRFQYTCLDWAGGTGCMLRAVSSTGGLTLGSRRIIGCDSDEKWYLTIWRDLSIDIAYNIRQANQNCSALEDVDDLVDFEKWVDEQVERLEESYGLTEWDASNG